MLAILWVILSLLDWGDKLKQFVLAPALIAQGISANVELRNLQNMLVLDKTANERLLPEEQFEQFVCERFDSKLKNPLKDPWGANYRYAHIAGGFALGSAGPDGTFQTMDDITLNWRENT